MSERVGSVVSVRVGTIRTHARPEWDAGRTPTWQSAYWKEEVAGPVRIGALGLEGDEHADRRGHGGVEMAVLMYAEAHYADWRALPELGAIGPGGFGENLTVRGLDEHAVCVGDVLEAGGAELQVASPRGPCANIARRWNVQGLNEQARELRRTGWYLRVRREGPVAIGDPVRRLARPHPGWTIDRLLRLRYVQPRPAAELAEAVALDGLSAEWRRKLGALMPRAS